MYAIVNLYKRKECELTRLKLSEQLKKVEMNTEITKVLDLTFEILSDPYYIWHK